MSWWIDEAPYPGPVVTPEYVVLQPGAIFDQFRQHVPMGRIIKTEIDVIAKMNLPAQVRICYHVQMTENSYATQEFVEYFDIHELDWESPPLCDLPAYQRPHLM